MKIVLVGLVFLLLLTSCGNYDDEVIEIMEATSDVYECVSRDLVVSCPAGLSSTLKSCYYWDEDGVKRSYVCYEGWVPYEPDDVVDDIEMTNSGCGDYFCYPNTDYCRLGGILSNPPVPKDKVC